MNRKEHLLTCLMEECSEVSKIVSKSLRFGTRDSNPNIDDSGSNEYELQIEFLEAIAVMEMLKEEVFEDILLDEYSQKVMSDKKDRVNHYMHYAKRTGTLNE